MSDVGNRGLTYNTQGAEPKTTTNHNLQTVQLLVQCIYLPALFCIAASQLTNEFVLLLCLPSDSGQHELQRPSLISIPKEDYWNKGQRRCTRSNSFWVCPCLNSIYSICCLCSLLLIRCYFLILSSIQAPSPRHRCGSVVPSTPGTSYFLAVPKPDVESRHPPRNGDLCDHRDDVEQAFFHQPLPTGLRLTPPAYCTCTSCFKHIAKITNECRMWWLLKCHVFSIIPIPSYSNWTVQLTVDTAGQRIS